MKTILSGLLALSLLMGGASAAFASSKKGSNGKSHSGSTHKRSNSAGRHPGSSGNRSGTQKSSNVPKNAN
jgi:hypothetical protein